MIRPENMFREKPMDLLTKTVTEMMLREEIDWPNAEKLAIDEFNSLAHPIIRKRFVNLEEDLIRKITARIWKVRRGGV